jgi:hypothetical protein
VTEEDRRSSPVGLAVFDLVHRYAEALHGGAPDDEPFTESTVIVQFCLAFFQQFLSDAFRYRLTALDETSAAEIARLRRRAGVTAEVADLLALCERLCDDWPLLSGVAYSDEGGELRDFHASYVPRLLRQITVWAAAEGLEPVETAARAAADIYTEASAIHAAVLALEHVDVREMIRLVELDYERTAAFSDGLVQREAAVRGLAVTVWVATLGFAFDRTSWPLAVLAAAASIAFALLDAYYSAVFVQLQTHLVALERLSATYYRSLRSPQDNDALADLALAFEEYRFGHRRPLRRVHFRDLFSVFDRVVFRFLYPPLVLAAVACALLIVR